MRGGAGGGVAAKEISATTDGARLPGKICVCEDMVAIFRRLMEIQNFWSSDGAVRRRFPTLATLRTPESEPGCRRGRGSSTADPQKRPYKLLWCEPAGLTGAITAWLESVLGFPFCPAM